MRPGSALPSGVDMMQFTSKTPEVLSSTVFAIESVKRLREGDFSLGSREKICLAYDDCILVLFYAENRESLHISRLWAAAASQVAGPVFAACNLLLERRVAEAFSQINLDRTHPFHWAGLKQIPFILTYQRGWPRAFFNGERTVETFIDYALTLACQVDYDEHEQLTGSMQAENRFVMTSAKAMTPRSRSTQFTGTSTIRHYNPNFKPVIKGSREEREELEMVQRMAAARQSSAAVFSPQLASPQSIYAPAVTYSPSPVATYPASPLPAPQVVYASPGTSTGGVVVGDVVGSPASEVPMAVSPQAPLDPLVSSASPMGVTLAPPSPTRSSLSPGGVPQQLV